MHNLHEPLVSGLNRREFIRATSTAAGGLMLAIALPIPNARAAQIACLRAPFTCRISANRHRRCDHDRCSCGGNGPGGTYRDADDLDGGTRRKLGSTDGKRRAGRAIYNNPMFHQQSTVGSFSVRGWYTELRRIGSAAREMLVQAAADGWGVSAGDCSAANSVITHRPSGRSTSFGSVAARAAKLPVPRQPTLKADAEFQVIGTSPLRVDVPDKVDGTARYGIDMVLPDMLYAAVKTCPTLSGKLKSFDDTAAKRVPGYHATVALPDGVIVVANSYWRAKKALAQVDTEYDLGSTGRPGQFQDLANHACRIRPIGHCRPQRGRHDLGFGGRRAYAGSRLRGALFGACVHGTDELHRAHRCRRL